jgi:ankyrin repeat protein
MHAATNLNIECLQELLSRTDINVNIKDNNGQTALMHITGVNRNSKKNAECLKLFFLSKHKQEIDINAQDNQGQTALMHAANGKIKCLKELLAREDININIKNDDGQTALIIAAGVNTIYHPGNTECLKLLLSHHDIDVNAQDHDNGFTSLMYAADNQNRERLEELLLRPDIDVTLKNNYDQTVSMLGGELYELCMNRALVVKNCLIFTAATSNKKKYMKAEIRNLPKELIIQLKMMLG